MARMGRETGEKGSGDPLTPRDQWPNLCEGLNKEWEHCVAHCWNYCRNGDQDSQLSTAFHGTLATQCQVQRGMSFAK